MIWDGLTFFSTEPMKLGRLRGEKVNFLTPLKSPEDLVIFLISFAVVLYLILG